MITVTDSAKEKLRQILLSKSDDKELGLRLIAGSSGKYAIVYDDETEDDMVIKHEDCKILMVNKDLLENLGGMVIDHEDSPEGSSLVIRGQ